MLSFDLKKVVVVTLITSGLFACSSKQEPVATEEMNEEAVGLGAKIVSSEANAGELAIGVPDRIFFAYDSSKLVPEAQIAVRKQADYFRNNKTLEIVVEGHCDARGTNEYNMALGEQRANAVKKEMIKDGLDAKNLKTVSYGKTKPAVEGDTEEAYQQNRRAVVIIK